jgi:hypothetical protein
MNTSAKYDPTIATLRESIELNIEFTTSERLARLLDGCSITVTVLDGEFFSGILSVNTDSISLWDGKEDRQIPFDDIDKLMVF